MSEPAPLFAASLILPIVYILFVALFIHCVLTVRRQNAAHYTPDPELDHQHIVPNSTP